MIKSMTGFASERLEHEQFTATVEIKSLNSKFFDLSLRIPKGLSDKEPEIRNIVSNTLERGKVTLNIDFQLKGALGTSVTYNAGLFQQYYSSLKELASSVGANDEELFKIALQSPDVMMPEEGNGLIGQFWGELQILLGTTLEGCNEFRTKEGESMYSQLVASVEAITDYKRKISDLDPERIQNVRERIHGHLEEFIDKDKIDENRFEQELIYFIEKLDISEELVRLESHLDYFLEIINQGNSMGKKLAFISQEIGREINTIGSKANDANIQKLVVQMKDELEKIKEQCQNVL